MGFRRPYRVIEIEQEQRVAAHDGNSRVADVAGKPHATLRERCLVSSEPTPVVGRGGRPFCCRMYQLVDEGRLCGPGRRVEMSSPVSRAAWPSTSGRRMGRTAVSSRDIHPLLHAGHTTTGLWALVPADDVTALPVRLVTSKPDLHGFPSPRRGEVFVDEPAKPPRGRIFPGEIAALAAKRTE